MKNLFMVSLGCPKNLVDSEVMLGAMEKAGYVVCQDAAEAAVILVNTCGFIQSAAEEAIDTILQLVEIKKAGCGTVLVVTGCLVQRYGEELKKELPEVDLFIGTEGFLDIAVQVDQLLTHNKPESVIAASPTFLMDSDLPRRISTPSHRAYLKITEGCSNKCSYCMIPSIRGKLRSRTPEDLLKEAVRLEGQGVKELTLVGQDLTAYGVDFGKGSRLTDLLGRLLAETQIPWLRMLYLYPNRVTDTLLDLIVSAPRLLPYFDIPLQHVSDSILQRMKRPYANHDVAGLLDSIRLKLPHAAIRTTFIVGFPGETEEDVQLLEDFLLQFRLNNVGIFTYSNEEGSAAALLAGHLPEEVKEARRERLMAVQAEISAALNQEKIGAIEKVLVEGVSGETDLLLEGRTMYQAPEIDGKTYINSGHCEVGDIVDLQITEAHTYDLVGEIIAPE